MEGIGLAFKQAKVRVHSGAREILKGLGHKRCPYIGIRGHLLNNAPEGHNIIRHGQHIGVAEIDFLLARRGFVVAKFGGDAERFQRQHGAAAK